MSSIGEGISSPAIEQDPGIAQIQAAAQSVNVASLIGLPETGFVASVNALSGLVTIQAGTSSSGVTVVVSSDGVSTISIGVTGLNAVAVAKSNTIAAMPNASNDESEGYSPFSIWLDNTLPLTPDFYMCASAATMAAIWLKLN